MKTKNLKTILKSGMLASMLLVVSCQQIDVLHEIERDGTRPNAYIEFGNYVNNMTRASKTAGNGGFIVGDTMATWGIQNTDGVVDIIFNNQDVRYVDGATWTYDNKKLWNIGSTYMFYGFFPYSKTLYSMSDDDNRYITIAQYTTPNDPQDQIDLMISERRDVTPFETVDMYFHHILSNVNVFAKVSNAFDTTQVTSITMTSIKFYNMFATGRYDQTGWSQERAVGAWSNLSDYMQIPAKTNIEITKTSIPVYSDYLMIPQTLFSTASQPKDICIDAAFRIVYKNGTTSSHSKKGIRLAGITGVSNTNTKPITAWQPNYRYNYTLVFNPQVSTRTWDADGDGSIQIDPNTGDTISKHDDTPYPGVMKYNPDEPDKIYVYEDTDNDGKPDTWTPQPLVWEDIDGDGLLEAGLDRDGDGHIDNVDGDDTTEQVPGGDPDKDPTDGNPNNPNGKDVVLVHYDSDGDGDVDDDDLWSQIQKDPDTGIIYPERQTEDASIEFTATVQEWEQRYSLDYNVNN